MLCFTKIAESSKLNFLISLEHLNIKKYWGVWEVSHWFLLRNRNPPHWNLKYPFWMFYYLSNHPNLLRSKRKKTRTTFRHQHFSKPTDFLISAPYFTCRKKQPKLSRPPIKGSTDESIPKKSSTAVHLSIKHSNLSNSQTCCKKVSKTGDLQRSSKARSSDTAS